MDFGGAHLVSSVVEQPPYLELEEIEGRLVSKGLFYDIARILELELNFTLSFQVPKDGDFARRLENGTWTGMIGELLAGKADIATASLTVTELRSKVVNFLIPVEFETDAIYIRNPRSYTWSWTLFLQVFSTEFWATLCLSALLLGLCLHLTLRRNQSCSGVPHLYGWAEGFFMVFRTNFGGKMNVALPDGWSGDMASGFLLLGILMTGNVVFISYRASLTSELSVTNSKLPFSTLDELQRTEFRFVD